MQVIGCQLFVQNDYQNISHTNDQYRHHHLVIITVLHNHYRIQQLPPSPQLVFNVNYQ